MKNSQKMAYIMNILYIEWIFEQISKKSKNKFIFCLGRISLYSESAAWLPDLCLDWDETNGIAKPSYCVIPYQAFEAADFEQDLPRNEIKGTIWGHVFSVHLHLR